MPSYLDATSIRALVDELGLRPSKGRGQNFLFDANTVRRIVNLAGVGEQDIVLEIGPGLGSLTIGLLHTGAQVVAVEIEEQLAKRLPATMAELAPELVNNLTVVEGDALKITSVIPTPSLLVANLPYNISVPVLLHVLDNFDSITAGLVMVQREVADRLIASPGSKAYGAPSAKLAWYAAASWAGLVPASVFWPKPKVESGLVRFVRREPPIGAGRPETFDLISLAFSQRRKMLRSVLSQRYGSGVLTGLARAEIAPEARGETLSVVDFARLAVHLCEL